MMSPKWMAILVLVGLKVPGATVTSTRPHIIIILADDLGHNDVSFHGSMQIPTPNLDALAYDGIILDNFYVHRICTPSRAALMTGRHPMQLGLQHGVILSAERYGLGLNETLLPQYLKKLGYATHIVGKWHLGFYAKEFTPTYRGFDSFYGFYQGHTDYYDHTFKAGDEYWGLDLRNNMSIVDTEFGQYGTEIFTREAVKVIENHDTDKPLFLYFPQQGVHAGNEETPTPLEAPWKYVSKFSHIQHEQRRLYAGMVSAVDDSVGNVTRALHERGMLNNSIIFFSTDNGGPAHGFDKNQACNWPLRGMKYTLWEGGVRGAAFLWSPKLQAAPYISTHLLQIEDITMTLLGAAHYDMDSLPSSLFYGKNAWQALSENLPGGPRKEALLNVDEQTGVKAIRMGDMKLVISGPNGITAEMDGWYRPPGMKATIKEELFKTDLPDILKDVHVSRRKHQNSPVSIDCGNTMLLQNITSCNGVDHPCLYNVTSDPCEYHDLSQRHPHLVDALQARLDKYARQAAPPRNKPNDPQGKPKYHNGVWTSWVKLSDDDLISMRTGYIL